MDLRDAFFDQIYFHAINNKDIYIVTNDMDIFSLRKFKDKFPDRFFNMGVAEQNMLNFAAGLASQKKIVLIYGILPFLVYRSYEQLKFNICSMQLPVILTGVGTGLSFSYDGPTHHATHDIASLNSLPELNIYNPGTPSLASKVANTCLKNKLPSFVRLDKGEFLEQVNIYRKHEGFNVIRNLSDINIIYTGTLSKKIISLLNDNKLKKFSIGLIELYRVKPFPPSLIEKIRKTTKKLIVIEENSCLSGISSILAFYLLKNNVHIDTNFFGLIDKQILNYGNRDWLMNHGGLNFKKIKNTILRYLNK